MSNDCHGNFDPSLAFWPCQHTSDSYETDQSACSWQKQSAQALGHSVNFARNRLIAQSRFELYRLSSRSLRIVFFFNLHVLACTWQHE